MVDRLRSQVLTSISYKSTRDKLQATQKTCGLHVWTLHKEANFQWQTHLGWMTTGLLRWKRLVDEEAPLRCSLVGVLLLWRCQCTAAPLTCLCWPAVAGGAQRLAENLQIFHHLHNIELQSQTPAPVNHRRASTVSWEWRSGFNLYERERFIKLHAS